ARRQRAGQHHRAERQPAPNEGGMARERREDVERLRLAARRALDHRADLVGPGGAWERRETRPSGTRRHGCPPLIGAVGCTIACGTEDQKRRYLARILSADEIWCQLFSEPGAGSDLAALRTRAEPDGDGFVVTGQKVWTSYAALSDWGILLARTDPTAPKHRGISYFLLDMRASGITVRPLRQATGSTEFSEVFLDRVRVEPEQLVGAVNQGWDIAMTTLAHERGTGFAFKEQVLQRIALEDAIALARTRR